MGIQDRDYMRKGRPISSSRRVGFAGSQWLRTLRVALILVAVVAAASYSIRQLMESSRAMPFPATGEMIWYATPQHGDRARLAITAPANAGQQYAVRLSEWESQRATVLIPVRAGETAQVEIPLGRYRVTMANGRTWLGLERLFGVGSEVREAIEPMEFYRVGNAITGHTIDLDSSLKGNMATRPAVR